MLKKSINKNACENYLLMISIRKFALSNKNVKTTLQERLSKKVILRVGYSSEWLFSDF